MQRNKFVLLCHYTKDQDKTNPDNWTKQLS
ncbi:Protein of unknown function [Lactobacillus helveticus CIRM-BIA 951]|uniref:Uncharacterized protein n=1 Tax=Lactobacillus helveticus CIRM-BIA 951 TaxID=1226334 RepID=U6F5B4_LACHE|nr:Protein of unknown function [Lactobacillus helveticus CIRM-BIA 951]